MLVVTGIRPGRHDRVRLTDDNCRVRYFTGRLAAMEAAFKVWQRGFLTAFRIENFDFYGRPSPPHRGDTR
ncbi:MAG: hypothetical protein ISN28_12415 [Ectothiorhodospiraceae bacterium AqS1]|nr:hypothetical protein [Ectothiorhodospiraceae bacterium AqS1]